MTRSRERIFRGSPVSHGFARGKVFVYKPYLPELTEHILRPSAVDSEVRRFDRAVRAVQRNLRKLHGRVKKEMGRDFAEFVEVQLALLADEEILGQTRRFIRKRARNAEFAYAETLKHLTRQVAASEVALFRERALDVVDVGSRVLQHLLGDEFPSLHTLDPDSIVVARDLPPSEAALLDPVKVRGLILEGGGRTSHTAIMAKAKEIPAVVGVDGITRHAHEGQVLFVDGYRGLAILNPTRKRLRAYEDDIARYRRHRQSLSRLVAAEPVTADGRVIDLSANIEFLAEAETALKYGAKGIGLFRTEYMYIARQRPPTEDEQFEVFARVARLFDPLPVIIRTFDLGGDKVIPGYTESNPFLGWRGLRLCFDHPGLFRGQLRAILRASAVGNVKIMFPMVSAIEELRRAKLLVEEAKDELKRACIKYDEQIDVGVMVETPAAALMADELAKECAFLSVGSNDLTQYTLAVDRGNERVAGLFDQFHPAVLHLIRRTIDAAHRQGVWVGLCGELAGDPLGIVVLLGLRIDEISVAPGVISEAKNIIRSVDIESAAGIIGKTTELSTPLEIRRTLRREMYRRFPKLAEFMFELEQEDGNHV